MTTEVENPQTAGFEEDKSASEVFLPSRRNFRKVVFGIVILLIAAICGGWYLYARGVEDTDDAQVDGHLVPVASRVEGTIQVIAVDDNQTVTAGTTLVQLDPEITRSRSTRRKPNMIRRQLNWQHPTRMCQ